MSSSEPNHLPKASAPEATTSIDEFGGGDNILSSIPTSHPKVSLGARRGIEGFSPLPHSALTSHGCARQKNFVASGPRKPTAGRRVSAQPGFAIACPYFTDKDTEPEKVYKLGREGSWAEIQASHGRHTVGFLALGQHSGDSRPGPG